VIGRFQRASSEETREAVEAANRAFSEWRERGHPQRAEIMELVALTMRSRKYELAAAVTLDNGKNRYEALADVDGAIDFLRYYAMLMGEYHGYDMETPRPFPDEYTRSLMRPYGAWAVICPFNFPVAITTGMTSGALITGNTVVMKPPSPVPYPPYLVARIMLESGVPGGAINFLAGPGSVVGESLVKNPGIAGIVFTGSKEVGYHMLREALLDVPRLVIAEMGGKNPIIVTENADIKKAVEGVIASAFGYGGQKCSACSRLYLQETVFDEFMSRFLARVREIRVGDPSDRDVLMGPVIHGKAYDDFQRYSTMAREGGHIEVGGEVIKDNMEKGFFVRPTVVTGLPEDHFLVKNELFLPFLCVQRFRDLEEALNNANDVEYGLTAGIFSESEEEIDRFFTEIEAGVVYSNRTRGGSTGAMVGGQPFGGWKGSGSTGKGAGGLHYLIQFMREQSRTECE